MPVPRVPIVFDQTETDIIFVLYNDGSSSVTSNRTAAELRDIFAALAAQMGERSTPRPAREAPLHGNHFVPQPLPNPAKNPVY